MQSHGASELSRKLGMTKNMVYRALTTLLSHGYVVRDPSGSRYQLGHRAAESGRFGFTDLDVPSLCAPFARQLVAISGETVSLVVPIGRSNVVISGVEGPGPIARGVPLRRLNPMHASSASRTILAHLTDEARG